jgi:hypothetical protein
MCWVAARRIVACMHDNCRPQTSGQEQRQPVRAEDSVASLRPDGNHTVPMGVNRSAPQPTLVWTTILNLSNDLVDVSLRQLRWIKVCTPHEAVIP